MNPWRVRRVYAAALAGVVCVGLLCRWPALGLPWPVAKYAGSTLWGAMVYVGFRGLRPQAAPRASAAWAAAAAVGVELFRLYRAPALDAFRATLAGKLLLGSLFSPWNILAYLTGIGCAALVDSHWRAKQGAES